MSPRGRSGWFTSSYTNSSGSCVEVKFDARCVLVRDSKDRRVGQPEIAISKEGWSSFVNVVGGL
ncbi:DUF397 domain-containing protein [Lentzea alba]|uniref:DUF397 domain-containing protein n=1 Tax=Lentzea alba TaxID=2714351 RepID=UPI0039BF1E23